MINGTDDNKSIVLIVGAGASSEVKLPVGKVLKDRIAKVLDIRFEDGYSLSSGDEIITAALRELYKENTHHNPTFNQAQACCWRIRDAMPQAISIDNFIDSHRDDNKIATCGKLAIARTILEAESNSTLNFDRSNIYNKLNFKSVADTWYNSFFQLLTENCQREDIGQRLKKIAIISFNYDRCIEHYLHQALQNYYIMDAVSATAAIQNLEIHHPYGTVGALPWSDQTTGIEYGAKPSPLKLINLASHLRTFTEGTDPSTSDIAAIRNTLASADRIVFLGFAFHRLNLELLFQKSNPTPTRNRRHYATAYGLSQSDIEFIKTDILNNSTTPPESMHFRSDLTCAKLFSEFWRGLSLSQ